MSDSFRFACPKCSSLNGEARTTNNTFGALNEVLSLAYSCSKCGTRIYGQAFVDEHALQKERWENLLSDPAIPAFWNSNRVSLSFPSAKDITVAVLRRGVQSDGGFMERLREVPEDFQLDLEVRTEVATQVRTTTAPEWKCGENGRWCHNTCCRHGQCMYLSREEMLARIESERKSPPACFTPSCENDAVGKSKYCSPKCGQKNAERAYRLRKKEEKADPKVELSEHCLVP